MTHHDHDHSHDHSHEHTHENGHTHSHAHSHEHGHDHTHDHDHTETMGFEEKMVMLLDHWVKHNDDHAQNYREWADKASSKGLKEAAEHLKAAADMTDGISDQFRKAMKTVQK